MSLMAKEAVVLVHGLWMHGLVMKRLSYWLRLCGFETHEFSYDTVGTSVRDTAACLACFVRELGAETVHLVGHSLGGIVILQMLANNGGLPPGRVVLLGSPVRGSNVARGLQERGWGGLLGKSAEGALVWPDKLACDGGREVGTIAGTRGLGLGLLFRKLEKPHDGTVSVAETRLNGAKASCELPLTHTSMLFSRRAADQVAQFLRHASFA